MPVISRPPKALGNADYADEVAQGKPDIIDVELDNDIKPLYALQNHGIDTANLSDNAEIKYTQLHRPIGIQQSDFAPGVVVPPGSVDGSALKPNSVSSDKIVPGATTTNLLVAGNDTEVVLGANVETLLAEVSWTTAGGFWVAHASFVGWINPNVGGEQTITFRLRVGSTANGVLNGTPAQQATMHFAAPLGAVFPISAPLLAAGNFLEPHTDPRRVQLTAVGPGTFVKESARLIVNESR